MRGSRDTSPYLLTSGSTPVSVAYTAGVPGAPATLNARDLVNTLRVPIEVYEIDFGVDEPGVAANQGQLYGGLEIDLRLGRYNITNGFAPVGALALRRSSTIEAQGATVAFSPDHVRWILPKPLIVGPNEGFSGFVRANSGLAYNAALTGSARLVMVARGRRLPNGVPVPPVRAIPFVTGGFITVANRPLNDSVFRNPFQVPLHVTALIARPVPDVSDPPVLPGNWTITGHGNSLGEGGSKTIAPAVNGSNLFTQRFGIEESFDIDPGGSLLITTDAVSGLGVAVSMSGWREE